jgi:ParB family chromosome partitioning protein
MRIEDIEIDLIDITKGRRVGDPKWAEALAADMVRNGQINPIEVVEAGDRFRLIDGLHRLNARAIRGELHVTAKIKTAAEVASDTEATLREIAANFMTRGLSVLDKARDVARWREAYEQAAGAIKPGKKSIRGKSAPNSDELLDAQAELFASSFSEAAQAALGMNKDAIKRSLRIARINDDVRIRLSLHKIANNQSELLALCAQTDERQSAIAGLLLSEPPAAHDVAGAIAILDRVPREAKPEPWARVSDQFNKLPEAAKRRFIVEHWDMIEDMLAERQAA